MLVNKHSGNFLLNFWVLKYNSSKRTPKIYKILNKFLSLKVNFLIFIRNLSKLIIVKYLLTILQDLIIHIFLLYLLIGYILKLIFHLHIIILLYFYFQLQFLQKILDLSYLLLMEETTFDFFLKILLQKIFSILQFLFLRAVLL